MLLLDEIRAQGLAAGTRIPSERELMARLGVGRSTIREVINGLAILGALEIRHGQGAFVLNPTAGLGSPNPIAVALASARAPDLLEARRLIEVHTARLAADRLTGYDLSELVGILEQHARAISARMPTLEHATRFHCRLAWAAGNEMLAHTVECVEERLSERGPLLHALPGFCEWELRGHRDVLVPVCEGDPKRAAERMHEHLNEEMAWHERVVDTRR